MDIFYNPGVMFLLFIIFLGIGAGGRVWKDKRKAKPERRVEQVNVGLSAVLMAVMAIFFFQLPSLSIDIEAIFSYAFDVVNSFMPLIAIVAGLGLGFNLINKITSVFNRSL